MGIGMIGGLRSGINWSAIDMEIVTRENNVISLHAGLPLIVRPTYSLRSPFHRFSVSYSPALLQSAGGITTKVLYLTLDP